MRFLSQCAASRALRATRIISLMVGAFAATLLGIACRPTPRNVRVRTPPPASARLPAPSEKAAAWPSLKAVMYQAGGNNYVWAMVAFNPHTPRERTVRVSKAIYWQYLDGYSLSSNGRWFAYCAYTRQGPKRGIGDLYLTDCVTGRSWQITRDSQGYRCLTFSPSGRWLAYCRMDGDRGSADLRANAEPLNSIWALDTRTRQAFMLTRSRGPLQWGGDDAVLVMDDQLFRFGGGAWSGSRLISTSGGPWPYTVHGRLAMDGTQTTGLPAKRAYHYLPKGTGDYGHPSTWRSIGTFQLTDRLSFGELSPAGDKIMFDVSEEGRSRLLVLDVARRTLGFLAFSAREIRGGHAQWSRDGQFVIRGAATGSAVHVDKIIAYRVADASEVPLDRLKDVDWSRLPEVTPHVLWRMRPGEGAPEFWVEEDAATAKPPSKQQGGQR